MNRNLRPLASLALVALVILISAACGSDAPSETGSGTASSTATGANKAATDQDKAVKFAECIRNNGVSDFPDPDAKGEFAYGVSVSPAVFKRPLTRARTWSHRAL